MSTLYQVIARPYWHGYEAPSTAHLSTDLVTLKLGGGDIELSQSDHQVNYPDVLDVLIELTVIRTSKNPIISAGGLSVPVFGASLSNHNVEKVEFRSGQMIRKLGVISKTIYDSFVMEYSFQMIPDVIVLEQTIPVGGFWADGAKLEDLCQHEVSFYKADGEIRYHFENQISVLQKIRDGQFSVALSQQDSLGCEYQSVDLVRHGTTTAWLTLHKR